MATEHQVHAYFPCLLMYWPRTKYERSHWLRHWPVGTMYADSSIDRPQIPASQLSQSSISSAHFDGLAIPDSLTGRLKHTTKASAICVIDGRPEMRHTDSLPIETVTPPEAPFARLVAVP